jgi:hypothetical protein
MIAVMEFIAPPPNPVMDRPSNSTQSLGLKPQIKHPIVKIRFTTRRLFRRPKISLKCPVTGMTVDMPMR